MYTANTISTFVSGLALVASVSADYRRIEVGSQGKLVFNPASTDADVGDIIEFVFFPKNHSVVQSTFQDPCESTTGFFSGFMPVPSGEGSTNFLVTVNDTKPIWFYCSQPGHCAKGMVGCINCPKTGNTLDAFTSAAMETTAADVEQPDTIGGGVFTKNNDTSGAASSSTSSMSTSTAYYGSGYGSATSTPASSATSSRASPSTTSNAASALDASNWFFVTVASGLTALGFFAM